VPARLGRSEQQARSGEVHDPDDPKRFAKRDDPLAAVLEGKADMAQAIAKIEKKLGGKLA
jgi:hypothetical protein